MQLRQLSTDLEHIDPNDHPSWRTGTAFNALLAEAKEKHPENKLITGMEPLEKVDMMSGPPTTDENAGNLRVLVGQLLTVVPREAPRIA